MLTSTSPIPAAVAVLAFFALRPRKGWLRMQRDTVSFADTEGGLKDSSLKLSVGDKGLFSSMPAGVLDSFLPAAKQSQAAALAAAQQPDNYIPADALSRWAVLPYCPGGRKHLMG